MEQLLHQQTVTLIQASSNIPNGAKVPTYTTNLTFSNNALNTGSFTAAYGGSCVINSLTNFQPVIYGACGRVQGYGTITQSPSFRFV